MAYASPALSGSGVAQAVGLTLGDAVITTAGMVNGVLGINTELQNSVLSQSNAYLAYIVENAWVSTQNALRELAYN